MIRSILEYPEEVPEIEDFHPDATAKAYLIQVITPIFGGGVKPGENDLDMIIRPSSIRGHLRFWWRAVSAGRLKTATQLLDREGEVWGTSDSPSPITIQISQPISGSLRQRTASDRYGFQSKYGPESYVLFPARESESPICREGFSFQLKINWLRQERLQYLRDQENAKLRREGKAPKAEKIEDIGPDIQAAIWAWTNFGGIGSRTRRGCGALFCKETAPASVGNIGEWYRDHLKKSGQYPQKLRAWPTLPDKILIGSATGKPVDEWANVIEIMRYFRQGVGVGRNPGSSENRNMPGRSRWPEPETIRNISQSRMPKHQRLNHIPEDSFPRAELGLPIVFHFKDGRDPPESELCPVGKMRMASPLILRPMAFGDGNRAVQLIIRLSTEPLSQVELKVGGRTIGSTGQEGIRNRELAAYRGSPMSGLTTIGSALDAFIAFAKKNEFKEVGL